MSASVSVISFNMNGTKDKDLIIDELIGSYDLVCLQEHLLTASSLNFLRRSQHHTASLSPAKVTGGHRSDGLACVFRRDIHLDLPSTLLLQRIFLAMRVGSMVFIKSCLQYEGYSIRS